MAVKVGLMGFGFMGKAHAACYCSSKKGNVVAIWDSNPSLLDPNAKATSPDFAYAFFLDPANQVLAHTFTGNFPDELRLVNRFEAAQGTSIKRISIFGETFRDFAVPMHRGELGVFRVPQRRLPFPRTRTEKRAYDATLRLETLTKETL